MSVAARHAFGLTANVILGVIIAYLRLSPPPPKPSPPGLLSDKAYHTIAFAALVFPSALLYARSLIWVAPAALLFGGVIEVIQPYLGRSAEAADFPALAPYSVDAPQPPSLAAPSGGLFFDQVSVSRMLGASLIADLAPVLCLPARLASTLPTITFYWPLPRCLSNVANCLV